MKVLLINGSSKEGCTYTALSKVAESLKEENIETEIIRNENREIISRNIYIVDIPYYQKNQYPYIQKSKEGINKIVKDNNIKYNIDDLFYLIINNSNEIPQEFLTIIDRLEFNYDSYMIEYMKKDKINMIKNIVYVLYDLYNSNFQFILQNVNREHLINLYFLAEDNNQITY